MGVTFETTIREYFIKSI